VFTPKQYYKIGELVACQPNNRDNNNKNQECPWAGCFKAFLLLRTTRMHSQQPEGVSGVAALKTNKPTYIAEELQDTLAE